MFAVSRKTKGTVFAGRLAAAAFLLLILRMTVDGTMAGGDLASAQEPLGTAFLQEWAGTAKKMMYDTYMPGLAYTLQGDDETSWILKKQIDSILPFYGYITKDMAGGSFGGEVREILLAEADEGLIGEYGAEPADEAPDGTVSTGDGQQDSGNVPQDDGLIDLFRRENEAAYSASEKYVTDFVPHVKQAQVDVGAFGDYEDLLKEFYTVDPNTMADSGQLNAARMAAEDLTIDKSGSGPQILIYHTHSQEGFADSVQGDDSTNIQAAGERLARILEDTYGYKVIHHTEEYDIDGRGDAYAKALPGIERVLEENPSVQVVIDLHRDEVPEGTRLVTDIDGRPTAKFMFFNGLSRTRTTGEIAYLYNENLEANLAFSFQMQLKAAEYYPGLTRRIYLKGYRYNMHLRPRSLLIELGAQNNTLEEALNACDPLAHILDLVLSGE